MLKARNDTMLMAYQNLWKNMAVAFGATESAAAGAAKKVVDFEIEIANVSLVFLVCYNRYIHVCNRFRDIYSVTVYMHMLL